MRKNIKCSSSLFFILLLSLFYSSPALARMPFVAEMSDDEKRAFIENLAEPSKEKMALYRWQSEETAKELLESGEITEFYKNNSHYNLDSRNNSGAGLYVAEDMITTSNYGPIIVQVEVEPGYRFLDLSDKTVIRKLKEKGVSLEDVYTLNPKVAVRDVDRFGNDFKIKSKRWVLKASEGIKF